MNVKNGKITECTEAELYDYWLARGYDDIYSFPEYEERCKAAGTTVTDEDA
ncbi:MAG: hypothetical protein IKT09_05060 [Synergistes sp.]|nr:hypothetical protein [Synergistes sp.]